METAFTIPVKGRDRKADLHPQNQKKADKFDDHLPPERKMLSNPERLRLITAGKEERTLKRTFLNNVLGFCTASVLALSASFGAIQAKELSPAETQKIALANSSASQETAFSSDQLFTGDQIGESSHADPDVVNEPAVVAVVPAKKAETPKPQGAAAGAPAPAKPAPLVPGTFNLATDTPWNGPKLNRIQGINHGPTGKETFYNLYMGNVVTMMRQLGFNEKDYPYWVREDGCKMLGPYIMVAANFNVYPRGSTVNCSLGKALVCDTGDFIYMAEGDHWLDIATTW